MDKPVAYGAVISTLGTFSRIQRGKTSTRLYQYPSTDPTVFVFDVSSDQDAIFGSAGPYDDDWEVSYDGEKDQES